MKEDIISEKLRRELSDLPIDTESRVMYLLVEIRKVLEHENNGGNILRFYCNWVVHTKMDRPFAKQIFKKICSDGVESSQIISFAKLKRELKRFLKERELPTDLTDRYWGPFREKLIDILVDTPIENVEKVTTGTFFFQRRSGRGVEFCLTDQDGIRSFGRILDFE